MKQFIVFLQIISLFFSLGSPVAFAAGPDEGPCTEGAAECNEGDCADATIGCFCAGLIAGPTGTCQRRGSAGDGCVEDASCRPGLVCPLAGESRGRCSTPPPVEEPASTIGDEESGPPARTDYSPASFGYVNPLGTTSVPELISRLIRAVLGVVGALFLAMFVYGGVLWTTAGGDAKKVQNAKTTLINAVIGIMIIAFSYAIVSTILGFASLVTTSS
ncbi:hypothetical protein IT407_04355 [Candidatus Uhrbacteria bacterium]|nr:hypothetical protein [Candidatus Uhrbacteria bacterium]